jgi:hypothetical protein
MPGLARAALKCAMYRPNWTVCLSRAFTLAPLTESAMFKYTIAMSDFSKSLTTHGGV